MALKSRTVGREGDYIVLSNAPLTMINKEEANELIGKVKSLQSENRRLEKEMGGMKVKLEHVCKLLGISMNETIMSVNDKVRLVKEKSDKYELIKRS